MQVTNHLSQLQKNNLTNNVRASIVGYCSTVYVAILNPLILSKAGMPTEDVFIATCLTMALSCYFIAYFVKLPILTGPTMALNAYFVTGLCGNFHMSWPHALGIVFLSGIIVILLANTNIKNYLLNSIPHELEQSITYGIGLFLALIAINCSSIYNMPENNFDLQNLGIFALTVSIILVVEYKKKSGSVIIALTAATILSCWLRNHIPEQITYIPNLKFNTLLAMQLPNKFDLNSIMALFAVIIIVIFDSGISGKIITKKFVTSPKVIKEKTKGIFKAIGLSTIFAGLFGTSSTGVYLESLNIAQAKGSAGYIATITGSLFLVTILFKPLIFMIPAAATSATLFYIALNILKNWQFLQKFTLIDLITSLAIIIIIPLNSSIPDGIGVGVIMHTLLTYLFTTNYKFNKNRLILCIIFMLFFLIKIIFN
ncbi:MAG: NCS2 family permease [Legionellales bacterium]|jgi:adenine/guanine/hypoxanthine permease|nr:NCS2 family permease [Legionellales bacterium]